MTRVEEQASTSATMTSTIFAEVTTNQARRWPCARPVSHRTQGPAAPASEV